MSTLFKDKNPKPKPSFTCEYCDKKFSSSSNLDRHGLVHTGERPFSCNLCNYFAARETTLQTHVRSHPQEKPFKCQESECNYSASDKQNLTLHHKSFHLQEKPFGCPISNCSYKSVQKSNLTLHMKTHEENPERPFKCAECPFKAKTGSHLKNHMSSVHSTLRNFKCPKQGCEYASKTKGDLTRHLETHGEKTLVCPHPNCDYKTNLKQGLKNHKKIHGSYSESEKKHKCRICDYSTHRAHNLTGHMRTHTKEAPYKCKVPGCSYEAKESSALNQHVRIVHEKIRPFKCPVSGCSYAATVKINLKGHHQNRHSKPTPISNVQQKLA